MLEDELLPNYVEVKFPTGEIIEIHSWTLFEFKQKIKLPLNYKRDALFLASLNIELMNAWNRLLTSHCQNVN